MNDQIDNQTTIKDIDIPFGRLVVIILKFMLASIPALLVFYALMFFVALIFMMLFGGAAMLSHLHTLPNIQHLIMR